MTTTRFESTHKCNKAHFKYTYTTKMIKGKYHGV